MSDTVTDPQDGATQAEPAATEADTTQATAAVDPAAATTEPEEAKKPTREERRFAILTAKLAAAERRADELEQRARAANPEPVTPVTPEDIPRVVEEKVAEEIARRETQRAVEAFHTAGRAAFPDWTERCQSLMQMGADAGLAELLVETPDGAKVAAALADDPETLETIAGLKTERARAIALGKFAAELATRPAAPARPVSQAPEPVRPLGGTSARTVFNEHRASAQELVEFYSKQEMAKRQPRAS